MSKRRHPASRAPQVPVKSARHGSRGEIRGAALIIVLAFLVIITGLVVAFLSSITNESTGSKATADASTTRTLADSTIQLAIAQIRDATAGFARDSNGALVTATNVTWASQPGAIRTYDTRGSNVAVYKLYSSTNMVERSGIYNPTNDLPPTNWTTGNIGQWVDLNEPVVAQGVTNYPIMDPFMTNQSNGATLVDGFSIATNNAAVGGANVQNRAAMPVHWLYVLRDGSITCPSGISTNNGLISFTNLPASITPTSNNPIVARIAFWTDDETCKLNLNTASEGSFWGVPHYSTSFDVAMAQYPPSVREYNRFPGHPASTCLSPVLWSELGLTNPSVYLSSFPVIPMNGATPYDAVRGVATNFLSPSATTYYSNVLTLVAPRYDWGGSFAGSRSLLQGYAGPTNGPILGNDLSSNRLYASVDEFFFNPTNSLVTNRVSNALAFSQQEVSRLRFFLTTTSRAPEVNPQNLPKICMWPVPFTNYGFKMIANSQSLGGPSNRTVYDETIAFCSTLGTNPYHITRYDATRTISDFHLRNRILYSYLRNCLAQPVAGYPGGAFTPTKWTAKRADQITTLLFDYIRSTINLSDSSSAQYSGGTLTNTPFRFSYTVPYRASGVLEIGTGQVAPLLTTNGTMGMGRIPTLRGGALLFMARAADQPPLMLNPDRRPRVFDASGSEISQWDGTQTTIPTSALTNIVMKGRAYALVNPMHPWTCPPMGATDSGTAGNFFYGGTNRVLTNVTATITNSMFQRTNILVPQLCRGASNTPVLADSAPLNTNKILTDNSSSNAGALFPIFDLSASRNGMPNNSDGSPIPGKGAPYTKTFPCLEIDTNATTARSAEASTKSYFWVTANTNEINLAFTNSLDASARSNGFSYFTATNMTAVRNGSSFTGFAAGIATNVITHTGLPFLSVPNASNGNYSFTNRNFIDGAQTNIALYQTRMEALYLPDLVNVSPGQIGINPSVSLVVDSVNLNSLRVNGTNMSFPSVSGPANPSRSGGFGPTGGTPSEGRNLYSLGLQYLMAHNGWTNTIPDAKSVIQCYTTNGAAGSQLLANGQTFSFTGGDIQHSFYYLTNSTSPVQRATLNFPDATFPTPMLPATPYIDNYLGGGNATYSNNFILTVGGNNPPVKYYPPDRAVYIQYLNNATPFPIATASRCTPWDRLTAYYGRDAFQEHFNFPSYMNCSDVTNSSAASAGVSYCPLGGGEDSYRWYTNGMNRITADTIQAVELKCGDPRLVACLTNIPSTAYSTNPNYGDTNQYSILGWPVYLRNAHSMRSGKMPLNGGMYGSFLAVTNAAGGWSSSYHYPPMVRGMNIGATITATTLVLPSARMIGPINFDGSLPYTNPNNFCGYTLPRIWSKFNPTDGHSSYPYAASDCAFTSTNAPFFTVWSRGGDFDNGYAATPDGPMINKPDDGMGSTNDYSRGNTPYFTVLTPNPPGTNTFSPNRMVASPVLFGSLPTLDNNWDPANPVLTITNSSWQTLQFSPNPNALDTNFFARRTATNGYSDAGMRPTNTVLPDHLLLDYFWMPVVEPYPISEPFSTAGKVNMNYAIAPFFYIRRDAAVRGVLKPVMISAVDDRWSYDYKLRNLITFDDDNACLFNDPNRQINPAGTTNPISYNQFSTNTGQFYFHYPIHLSNTLLQFDYRFTNAGNGQGDLFRSPSEICTLWLYPGRQPTTANPTNAANPMTNSVGTQILWNSNSTSIESWWYDNPGTDRKGLTGDNVRERPYNYLYPRLTTKSNTYQIHYRVQLLKQSLSAISTWPSTPRSRDASGWTLFIDPSNTSRTIRDQVVGELRGSATIERYIDPSDTTLPDFAGMINSSTNNFTNPACIMDTYYKFRVFNFKVFTP